jgi:hypothetical protein
VDLQIGNGLPRKSHKAHCVCVCVLCLCVLCCVCHTTECSNNRRKNIL